MSNLNKIISLIIGLLTIVVFFAVLTGRINLGNKLPRTNITPTPAKKTILIPTLSYKVNQYQNQNQTKGGQNNNLSNIPRTGIPIPLIPALFTTLLGGIYLNRKNN